MSWQVINQGGDVRIGFVTKGGIVHNMSTNRYGTQAAAHAAAVARNRSEREQKKAAK